MRVLDVLPRTAAIDGRLSVGGRALADIADKSGETMDDLLRRYVA